MDGQRIHFNENVNQKDIYRIRKKVQFFGQKKDREIDLSMYIKGRFDKSKQKLRNLSNSLVAKWMSDQRGGRIIKKKMRFCSDLRWTAGCGERRLRVCDTEKIYDNP